MAFRSIDRMMVWGALVLGLCGCAADAGGAADAETARLVTAMMTEDSGTSPELDCAERETPACIGEGAPCAAPTEAFIACVRAASCITPDGLLDEPCAIDACPDEADALSICVVDGCPGYVACFDTPAAPPPSEPPPVASDACQESFVACVSDPCREVYTSFYECASAASCIDAAGGYDEACGDAACAAEIEGLNSCVVSSCEETLAACSAEPAPAPEPEPAPAIDCEQEIVACVATPDAPCAETYSAFLTCADGAGCIDADGVYDDACGSASCATPIAALQACVPSCGLSPECGG